MKLNEFVEKKYLPSLTDLRASTRIGYESTIALYLLPAFGRWELEDIKVWDIEQWLKAIPLPGAAEKAYKTLRQIIRRAIDWDLFDAIDPTRKRIKLPKKPDYLPKVLDKKAIRRMLRGYYGHALEAFILCAVTLGLRRGEACGLEWKDIDFRSGAVHISRSVQYIKGEVVTVSPKTRKSNRTLYLPRFALDRLRELRGFGRLIGSLTPDAVARRYKAFCKRESLPYTSLTNLRHTWATLALESGIDSATVAMMLGHSQISTTYEHYLVPQKRIIQGAQSKIERYLMVA